MQLRRAEPDDVAAIAEVHVRSWQVGYRGQLPDEVLDSLDPAQRVPRWRSTLEQTDWPRRGTLVVEDAAGRLVGFASLVPTRSPDLDPGSVGEVASFYVLPTAWNRGVGRRLMAVSLATLAGAGYSSAMLWVLASNPRAIRFYEAAGWRPDGVDRPGTRIGTPVLDLRYRHDLAGTPET